MWQKHKDIAVNPSANRVEETQEKEFDKISADNTHA